MPVPLLHFTHTFVRSACYSAECQLPDGRLPKCSIVGWCDRPPRCVVLAELITAQRRSTRPRAARTRCPRRPHPPPPGRAARAARPLPPAEAPPLSRAPPRCAPQWSAHFAGALAKQKGTQGA
eukprot:356109-Prorocentrum_minimum.AAC.3